VIPEPIFTADAEEDLQGIWLYIAHEGSVQAADKLIHELYEICQRLSEFQHIGTKRNFISPKLKDVRSWPHGITLCFTMQSEKESKLFAFCMDGVIWMKSSKISEPPRRERRRSSGNDPHTKYSQKTQPDFLAGMGAKLGQ
jgi:plasmid stabilization system protein ParE